MSVPPNLFPTVPGAGLNAGLVPGLNAGLVPGQTVTKTAHTERSAEFHNPTHAFGVPDSSSASVQDYRITSTAEPVLGTGAATTYQHHTARSNYTHGSVPVPAPIAHQSSVTSVVTSSHRQPHHRQQVIRLPDQAPITRQVRHRVPTPEPDTLERVYHQRVAGEVIEEITEIPTTPPPIVRERTVVEPSGPPQVFRRIVRVPPRSVAYGGYPQHSSAASAYSAYPASYPASIAHTGSYAQYRSAAPAYSAYPTSYGAPTAYAGGYGYPQQRPTCGNCTFVGAPVTGARNASCFYV